MLSNFKDCWLNAFIFWLLYTKGRVFLTWKFSSIDVIPVRREVGKSASINYLRCSEIVKSHGVSGSALFGAGGRVLNDVRFQTKEALRQKANRPGEETNEKGKASVETPPVEIREAEERRNGSERRGHSLTG